MFSRVSSDKKGRVFDTDPKGKGVLSSGHSPWKLYISYPKGVFSKSVSGILRIERVYLKPHNEDVVSICLQVREPGSRSIQY